MSGRTVVFEGDGSATGDGALIWVVVLGGVGSLTGLIVSFAIPEHAGPWWAWALGFVAVVGLAVWSMNRQAVHVKLVREESGLRLVVTGRGASIDAPLRPAFDHWHYAERMRLEHGGGVMIHCHVLVTTRDGRAIGFRQMGGEDAVGWPRRDARIADGPDCFIVVDIFGLQRALAASA